MIHKLAGIFALGSFAYRYAYVWPTTGSLGFDGAAFDWITMLMHLLLSASSIQFHVPTFRQPRRPTMIWHEYRVHAILFTTRCVLIYALGFYAPKAGAAIRFGVCMCMHILVDRVTSLYGKSGETTIRGRDNSVNKFIYYMRRSYAFYQFLALASHLTPSPRAMDMGYNTVIAIQSSAFLMTLNRKGLATWQTHFKIYSAALLLSAAYIISSMAKDFGWRFGLTFIGLTFGAFLLRTCLGVSKYQIWACYAVAAAYACGGAAAVHPAALFKLGPVRYGWEPGLAA